MLPSCHCLFLSHFCLLFSPLANLTRNDDDGGDKDEEEDVNSKRGVGAYGSEEVRNKCSEGARVRTTLPSGEAQGREEDAASGGHHHPCEEKLRLKR